MKKVAILQSNYIPWKGYFDLMNQVDEFIIYDIVQFTKNDWRNRNRIKTPRGVEWLTIPVLHHFGQTILETEISDRRWNAKHWRTICQNYAKAKYFANYKDLFESLYLGTSERSLSLVNCRFMTETCRLLGIKTKITWAQDYKIIKGQTERLVHLCQQAGATEYLSGHAARSYIDESLFVTEGIKLSYIDYSGYPVYDQLFPPFEHAVSIIDLIFNEGPHSASFMKSFTLAETLLK
jgi:hypothetical protein